MKLVSIVIPYYKKKKYISKTLNSIINQSYKKYEIIIVYDDENSEEFIFLKNITKKNKKIKLIKNKKQLGAGKSRNRGISISKGEYIAFIDADDLWKKDKLKIQLNFMIKNKIDFSHTSYEILNKNKVVATRIAKNFFKLSDILLSCDIGLSTVMIKKNIFKNKKYQFPKIKTKEDFVLWMKLIQNNNKIYGIKQKLTKWRKLESSLSSSIFQKIKDAFLVYNKYMKYNFFISILYVFLLSFNFLKKGFGK